MKEKIKGIIFDIDGVIWRDKIPIGNLEDIFQEIKSLSLEYTFATNNSTRSRATYQSLLSERGIPVLKNQIVTSASLAAETLSKKFPEKGNLFIIGMDGLKQELLDAGFSISGENVIAVIVGLDTNFNYETMQFAADLIRSGIPFFGTNPDVTLPTPKGLLPGTGSLLAALEAASGKQPIILGKPEPGMFLSALNQMGLENRNVIVVGDRLETDIAGGQASDCKVGLVLSGVTNLDQAETWKPKIDFIADDLSALIKDIAND